MERTLSRLHQLKGHKPRFFDYMLDNRPIEQKMFDHEEQGGFAPVCPGCGTSRNSCGQCAICGYRGCD